MFFYSEPKPEPQQELIILAWWAYRNVFVPTVVLVIVRKLFSIMTYGGSCRSLFSLSPSDVLLDAHNCFPFDCEFDANDQCFREAKELSLQGQLFYPGSPAKAVRFFMKLVQERGLFNESVSVTLMPAKIGVIEAARLVWNNRTVHDLYVNDKFVRQVTCLNSDVFKAPSLDTLRVAKDTFKLLKC